ncbi:MAG: glycosidase [Paludibacteraceae bacterium]|nr:glycosidase [Paludibacteraceae bacterium]
MSYKDKISALRAAHEALLTRKNEPITIDNWLNGQINDQMVNDKMVNGIYTKYKYPILTAEHTPLEWRYDFNEQDNPFLMQRIMMNAVLNAGAILFEGQYTVVARVEGADRKSFFAVAQSPNGIDNWRFWPEPITMPDGNNAPATNVYDMRLTRHEDGWIYGIFCVERHDETKPFDTSAATAAAGIARTKDLVHWERLNDLKSLCQQRNVVLHPEFVKCENEKMGKCYALYTRPQDGFIETGKGGGIGWTLTPDITHAEVRNERIIYPRAYHTVYEVKNGEGPAPIKTAKGWLHLAHGVRATASGLRYVLYMYMTALDDPTRVIARPGGWFLVPEGYEYIGDVMNVAFSNGWIVEEKPLSNSPLKGEDSLSLGEGRGEVDTRRVFIYYASADTRLHVATTTVEQLLDYCLHTPEDGLTTSASVEKIKALVHKNQMSK